MLEAFDQYVSNYDINDKNIKLKYNHSYRVMELNKKYAEKLGFSDEDIEIATIIGLLHDFGRFEQLRVYNSYNDALTIDHADYSIEQLFEKDEISKFTNKKEYYDIIRFAIQNHNKYTLPEINDERMLMHAKLIRDTDKLDIIYLYGYLNELNLKADSSEITKEVIDSIKKHVTIDRKYTKTKNDRLAISFAFAFDIYNDICLEELKVNLYNFYKQIDGVEKFKDIYNEIINYIDERIDNNVRYKV